MKTKLIKTKKFLNEGIKLYKLVRAAGFFSNAVYDYKTVYDLNEAAELTQNGWEIADLSYLINNLVLNLYRDLK